MYQLYTFAISSTAFRARIALNLKGITPEYHYVHLFKGDQKSEEYRKVNPNGGIPALITPEGTTLIESIPIIEYLNQIHPEPNNLLPGDAINRAQIRGFCEVINSAIHPYQNLRVIEKLQADYKADKKVWLDHWLTRGAQTLEKLLGQYNKGGKYSFGDQVTCADVVFYPQLFSMKNRFKMDLEPYPLIRKVLSTLEQHQAFKDAEPANQKDFEGF